MDGMFMNTNKRYTEKGKTVGKCKKQMKTVITFWWFVQRSFFLGNTLF